MSTLMEPSLPQPSTKPTPPKKKGVVNSTHNAQGESIMMMNNSRTQIYFAIFTVSIQLFILLWTIGLDLWLDRELEKNGIQIEELLK